MTDHDHDHDHEHEHDHSRTFQADHAEPTSDGARIGLALRELLIEAGHYTAEEEQTVIAAMQGASPRDGGKIAARAWVDAEYKKRLLDNGAAAIRELGYEIEPYEFTVMENDSSTHNIIVCTLCSCYPRSLLGMSPAWYKSSTYRARVVREPRTVLTEFGVKLTNDIDVRVHDSTAELRYMVLPERPIGTEDWSEAKLAALITRDSLIGTQRELVLP